MTDERQRRAIRATDSYTLEAYRLSAARAPNEHPSLIRAIRGAAIRSGGALVAAAAVGDGVPGRRLLLRARGGLAESRYYLSIARRVGLIDMRGYRGLTARQDAALRELDGLLDRQSADPPDRPVD